MGSLNALITGEPLHSRSIEDVEGLEFLLGSCSAWRQDGPKVKNLEAAVAREGSIDSAKTNFESAVLHAVNGGGQNQARAILTGALTGAQTGLAHIPQRFLNGLENGSELGQLVGRIASSIGNEKEKGR